MDRNLLDRETSPYLLQHKDNPVHWHAWGSAALVEAKEANKPILLSVGYAACHWCHVMAHESFEDDAIARQMNEKFINIKVDREERPDIDSIYQNALALLGQQGGWPLTMFLTPDGAPFWGGTYFPPEDRWGRPGLPQVLSRIAEIYGGDRALVEKNRTHLVDALQNLAAVEDETQALREDTLEQVAQAMLDQVDFKLGGLQGAPKFPQPALFKLFWRAWRKTGKEDYKRAVTFSLNRMCEGGLYDHLGGGFARYSVDDRWLAPHFEKMLYDNAQLLDLLCLAWQQDRTPLFAARVTETCDWLLREMIGENEAFAATIDADSEGEEGKFYVWSQEQVDMLLGDDAAYFSEIYGITPPGNWEGKTILNRLDLKETPTVGDEERLAPMRQKLLMARNNRPRPGWDDKILADWNGLMIAAIANAGAVFDQHKWIKTARDAYNTVFSSMSRPDASGQTRLQHSYRRGRAQHMGVLDDYANMARAALTLFEIDGSARYLEDTRSLITSLDRYFWDDDAGGYFFTARDAEALIVRTKSASDNAVPAGNGVMIDILTRVYLLTGESTYIDRAHAIVSAFTSKVLRQPAGFATLVSAFDALNNMKQIVIIGSRGDRATQDHIRAVHSCALVDRLLQVVPPGASLPAHHPAAGKTQQGNQATVYICVGQTCSLPISDPTALAAELSRLK